MRLFRKNLTNLFFLVFILFLVVLFSNHPASAGEKQKARNIILMIADGMGPGEFVLALDYSHMISGKELEVERVMREGGLGLVLTNPLKNLVTDSAASATAMSTGKSTLVGRVAKTEQSKDLKTILELAKEMGKSTGLVTTTTISHATPAGFGSHVISRDKRFEIMDQLLEKEIDVLMGGGANYWIPRRTRVKDFLKISTKAGADDFSMRKDKRNLILEAREKGYGVISNQEELIKAQEERKLLGLFSSSHLLMALDREENDHTGIPRLALMTEKALKILNKNERGFFLMVEGGRIDHAGHDNDAASVIAEILDFDEAVGAAFRFSRERKDTLLLITSDHTTGGTGISYITDARGNVSFGNIENLRAISRQNASFERIWKELQKSPAIKNIKMSLKKHTGITISDKEAKFIKDAKPISPFHVTSYRNRKKTYTLHAMGSVLGKRYQVSWSTGGHTNIPVMLVGYGIGSEKVLGLHKNTYIFEIMRQALGL